MNDTIDNIPSEVKDEGPDPYMNFNFIHLKFN